MLTTRSLWCAAALLILFPATVFASAKHVVEKGDTLYSLSKKFEVSVDEIKKANKLPDDNLKLGSVILVPSSKPEPVQEVKVLPRTIEYTVIKSDTLFSIAKGFKVSIDDLKKANNLTTEAIQEGQKLIVPLPDKAAVAALSSEQPAPAPQVVEEKKKPEVKVASVPATTSKTSTGPVIREPAVNSSANIFNSPTKGPVLKAQSKNSAPRVTDISTVSGMDLVQKKNAPTNYGPIQVTRRYVAKDGDTLSYVAKQFGTTVATLKEANGLKDNKLDSGSILLIPSSAQKLPPVNMSQFTAQANKGPQVVTATQKYVVAKGDTAYSISKKFNISVEDLNKMNNIVNNNIQVGQTLSIRTDSGPMLKTGTAADNSLAIKYVDQEPKKSKYLSRDTIINIAKKYLGVPYKFGGTSLANGLDCSAFINKVFGFLDVRLPRTAREIFKVGEPVKRDKVATGDLVFFRTYARFPSHVGIYLGDGQFIHASSKAKMVTINSLDERYYKRRYLGAKRIEIEGLFYKRLSQSYSALNAK